MKSHRQQLITENARRSSRTTLLRHTIPDQRNRKSGTDLSHPRVRLQRTEFQFRAASCSSVTNAIQPNMRPGLVDVNTDDTSDVPMAFLLTARDAACQKTLRQCSNSRAHGPRSDPRALRSAPLTSRLHQSMLHAPYVSEQYDTRHGRHQSPDVLLFRAIPAQHAASLPPSAQRCVSPVMSGLRRKKVRNKICGRFCAPRPAESE